MTGHRCDNCAGTLKAREFMKSLRLPTDHKSGMYCDILHKHLAEEDFEGDCRDECSEKVPVYLIDVSVSIEYRNKFNHVISLDKQCERVIKLIEPSDVTDWQEIYMEALNAIVTNGKLPIRPDGHWIQHNIYTCGRPIGDPRERKGDDLDIAHVRVHFMSDIQLSVIENTEFTLKQEVRL